MESITQKIASLDWETITASMHDNGFAIIPEVLPDTAVEILKKNYNHPTAYRKTVVMERYRFGHGEYKYFNYPLPDLLQELREKMYTKLAPIGNAWMKALNINTQFPPTHQELIAQCHSTFQEKATVLILKYGKGGYNTLHQDLYGAVYFPIQCVLFLNEPGTDYKGGEFVLMEQIPRAQSKAIVLQSKKGDILVFTTQFRPVRGTKGYFRVTMKHGISTVHEGERHTLGIIFHDALQ